MPTSADYYLVQERLLRAYDELGYCLMFVDLQTIKTTRRLVLDCYWTVNELRTNAVQASMELVDDTDVRF